MHHWCLKKQIKETIPSNTTIDIKVLNTQNIDSFIRGMILHFNVAMTPCPQTKVK